MLFILNKYGECVRIGITMRKSIFIVAAILSIGFTIPSAYGGRGMFDRGPSEEKSARRRRGTALKRAEQAFLKGDYQEVIVIGDGYLSRSTESDDELQHLMGRALLKLKRFNEARNRFSRVINDSKSDKFLDEAYIGLADSYYLEGDYKKAKEHYEKIMRYFPDLDDMPIVYYRLGKCSAKLGENSASKGYYDKLIRFYPDSLETKLLGGGKTDFVIYSVQVGSFKKWKNAERLCDELKNKGFDANIYTAILGDSRFYRVRVGQHERLSDVEDMARTLRNSGYSTKIYP